MPQEKSRENAPAAKTRKPPARQTEKRKLAPVSLVEEQPQCHIHEKVNDWEIDVIRENVCVNVEPLTEFEHKHYCLFHLPIKEKDTRKFEEKFRERIKAVEEKLKAIEALPEDQKVEAKNKISYDFRYVWFPAFINFNMHKFLTNAYFTSATFSDSADFTLAKFSADADFNSTSFSASVIFFNAEFRAVAFFNSANFSATADFTNAKFSADVNFNSTSFLTDTFFKSTKFSGKADFKSVIFSSSVFFSLADFSGAADFNSATFSHYAYFDSTTFSAYAIFKDTGFLASAFFQSAVFLSKAFFNPVIFSADTHFKSSIFCHFVSFRGTRFSADADFRETNFFEADFESAEFSADADFTEATFLSNAFFKEAKFFETSKIFFKNTGFCFYVEFCEGLFDGYAEFEGDVFLVNEQITEIKERRIKVIDERIKEKKIKLEDVKIRENQEAFLSLERAHFTKPRRISFNSIKLRPCWFINAEIQNLDFNEVEWQNIEVDVNKNGLNKEEVKLNEQGIKRSKEWLLKVCNQLADNAEANRRFEEAKQFRKQSIALQKKSCYIHDSIDLAKKKEICEKVCDEYPVVNEDGGRYYCLWHNPDKNKAEIFLTEFEKRRENQFENFQGVVFPITVEYKKLVESENGKFESRTIPLPPKLNFAHATFQRRLVIEDNEIHELILHNIYVDKEAEIIIDRSTCDGSIDLSNAMFEGMFFLCGKKDDKNFFKNPEKALNLKDARFGNPELINFHSLRLRPHYFTGVDASKFTFHDCEWSNEDESQTDKKGFFEKIRARLEMRQKLDIRKELKRCSHKELAQACNRLAINYEENRNFEESTIFRYMARQAKRFEYPLHGWFYTLDWFYWLSSGYGERRLRAAVNLVLIIVLFGFLYASPLSTFDYGGTNIEKSENAVEQQIFDIAASGERFRDMTWDEAAVHTLSVAAFLRPEPKAANTRTRFFVFFETILAPLQAALLALAIRRKFMR